ncbi:unnamed protein product [Polarella glacialis]|uniref:Uncharacterized protein n=1 Tax=Polarella glacialis TaxID=89957 RepID=A0A813D2L3_POLGL|nr:unnamed protein product [Polarella glacialis]
MSAMSPMTAMAPDADEGQLCSRAISLAVALVTTHMWMEREWLNRLWTGRIGVVKKCFSVRWQAHQVPDYQQKLVSQVRMGLQQKILTGLTAWSWLACTSAVLFLLNNNDSFEGKGSILRFHVVMYSLCLGFRFAIVRRPQQKAAILQFFVAVCQTAVLVRQLSTPPVFASSLTLTQLFRIMLVITSGNHRLGLLLNIALSAAAVYRNLEVVQSQNNHHMEAIHFQAVFLTEVVSFFMIFASGLTADAFFMELTSAILDMQGADSIKSAANRMLNVFCDAHVLLSSDLKILEGYDRISLLLKARSNAPSPVEASQGAWFLDYVPELDMARFVEFVSRSRFLDAHASDGGNQLDAALPTGSLQLQMVNAMGKPFNAELFHVGFPIQGSSHGHLIGIREWSRECETAAVDALPALSEDEKKAGSSEEDRVPTRELGARSRHLGVAAGLTASDLQADRMQERDTTRLHSETSSVASSAGSDCTQAQVALPWIKSIDLCIDPMCSGFKILSCEFNFRSEGDAADLAPLLSEVVLSDTYANFSGWIQDQVNEFFTASKQGSEGLISELGEAGKFNLTGTRTEDVLIVAQKVELFLTLGGTSGAEGATRAGNEQKQSRPAASDPSEDGEEEAQRHKEKVESATTSRMQDTACDDGDEEESETTSETTGIDDVQIKAMLRFTDFSAIPTRKRRKKRREHREHVSRLVQEQRDQLAALLLPTIDEATIDEAADV